jgi:hypothetical protein
MHPAAERIVDKIAKAPGTDMRLQQAVPLFGKLFNRSSLALGKIGQPSMQKA